MGAFAYLRKPASREDLVQSLSRLKSYMDRQKKTLLVVEDDPSQRGSIVELLSGPDVDATATGTGEEALGRPGAQEEDPRMARLTWRPGRPASYPKRTRISSSRSAGSDRVSRTCARRTSFRRRRTPVRELCTSCAATPSRAAISP